MFQRVLLLSIDEKDRKVMHTILAKLKKTFDQKVASWLKCTGFLREEVFFVILIQN